VVQIVFDLDTAENKKNFVEPVLDKIGYKLVAEIQRKIREIGIIDTGAFMRSIHHKLENGKLIIMDGVKYGKYLEWGTTRHFVAPRNKKALRWEEDRKGRLGRKESPSKAKIRFSKGHWVSGIQPYAPFRKGITSGLKNMRI
jgi:hypothetical protein